MLLALRAQQRDQVIVYCDRALSAGGLWPLQSEPVLRSLLDRSLDAQRLCRNVKIVPPQRQDFVAPCARERGNRHDREQRRSLEAFHEGPQLALVKHGAAVTLTR
jgi:hypothetical protein